MEKTEPKTKVNIDYRELYPLFLWPALVLLAAGDSALGHRAPENTVTSDDKFFARIRMPCYLLIAVPLLMGFYSHVSVFDRKRKAKSTLREPVALCPACPRREPEKGQKVRPCWWCWDSLCLAARPWAAPSGGEKEREIQARGVDAASLALRSLRRTY